VLVHTSGSTGEPKPMWVEKRRMEASACTTCRFLGLHEGDSALLCMSLDYIAGKMMVVRALTCGLRLLTVAPSSHPLADMNEHIDFAAMVPMQVYSSLQVPEECERLKAIRHLIIGGGAIDSQLEASLKTFPHAVWSTYGMTETLSHIAMRRVNGPDADSWYRPLEGVTVALADDGCLVVDAPKVSAQPLKTNDIAEIRDGRFRILGRVDNVICSGGVKIQIEEVERLLHQHSSQALMITKCSDEKYGEVVVLLTECTALEEIKRLCSAHLPKYWQPKYYYHVERLPFTETGKPARKQAEMMATRLRFPQP